MNEIILFTITLARDKNEEKTILSAIKALRTKTNLFLVVVDGGSSKNFLEKLNSFNKIKLISSRKSGLFNQIKDGLKQIDRVSTDYVFYFESNKWGFINNDFEKFLNKSNTLIKKNKKTGVILASRNKFSFKTFPRVQRISESIINKVLKIILKEKIIDYTYGPRIISFKVVEEIIKQDKNLGWGWMTKTLIICKKLEMNIVSLEMDLRCPEDERVETLNDIKLRLRQLKEHLFSL